MASRGTQASAGTTIKSAREIRAVFDDPIRVAHPLVVGLIARTPEGRGPQGRVAFVAGKRLGSAVKRNRAKRVMREAVRRVGGPWPGHDVVLVARERTGSAAAAELDRALVDIVRRGNLAP